MMDLAGEAIGRKPFSHRVGIKKRPVDFLRGGPQHEMKPDCVRSHDFFPFDVMTDLY
jgi:hypothetical protein